VSSETTGAARALAISSKIKILILFFKLWKFMKEKMERRKKIQTNTA
jgi:hypothetical protein